MEQTWGEVVTIDEIKEAAGDRVAPVATATSEDRATQQPSEVALVVVSIDGLASLKSGIGSIVRWFFEATDEIVASTQRLQNDRWSLHALSPRLDPSSEDYSHQIVADTAAVCDRYRGDFRWFDVEDNSSLKNVWSLDNVARWRVMCRNAAAHIRHLAGGRRSVTVLAHGTMFATLRSHLSSLSNVQVIYMTHTLGRVFLDANAANRTSYEDEGFAEMRAAPQDKIGFVGTYYRDVLLAEYDRRDDDLVPFQNAVYVRSEQFRHLTSTRLETVPADKRLIFSWGRCVPQKGFDVLIPAFGEFLARRIDADDWHLVLLAPQEVAAPEYTAMLREELSLLPAGSWTLIQRFDPLLPLQILASPSLEICVFASRFEAGPLTLIEALTFGHEAVRIVWHDIPPMRHILSHQPQAISFSPLQATEMSQAMSRAAEQVEGIVKNNVTDFAASMSVGLTAVLDWWNSPGM